MIPYPLHCIPVATCRDEPSTLTRNIRADSEPFETGSSLRGKSPYIVDDGVFHLKDGHGQSTSIHCKARGKNMMKKEKCHACKI